MTPLQKSAAFVAKFYLSIILIHMIVKFVVFDDYFNIFDILPHFLNMIIKFIYYLAIIITSLFVGFSFLFVASI